MARFGSFRRVVRSSLLVALLVALCGTGCKESDKEKAKKERAEIEKRVTNAWVLVPYRGIKTMVRSSVGKRPPELDKVAIELAAANDKFNVDVAANKVPIASTIELMIGAYRAREVLKKHDEDTFALLWEVFSKTPAPIAFYDNGAEHLVLGVTWIAIGLADKSGQLPVPDVLFYELSRVSTSPAWPWWMRVLGRGFRGVAQCHAGYHYAAEEELTGLVEDVEKATPAERAVLTYGQQDAWVDAELRATVHLLRAWNRFALDRKDAATDDLEEGLKQLERIGVDNELTQWAWAVVHTRRKRYDQAAASLEKLAQSPHLDATAKAEVQAAAVEVKKAGHDWLPLTSLRANYYILNALLQRAGGLEHICEVLLGKEMADKLMASTNFVRATQAALGQMTDEKKLDEAAQKLKDGGKNLLDSASKLGTDLGNKGLEKGKGLLDKLTK